MSLESILILSKVDLEQLKDVGTTAACKTCKDFVVVTFRKSAICINSEQMISQLVLQPIILQFCPQKPLHFDAKNTNFFTYQIC